jgi:hypothetical protein
MHDNFYHWHGRAELKPDVEILKSRWNAAAKFAEKISETDLLALLVLVLFPGAEPGFAKRFTTALVKAEPTFPPTNNAELLRVMAAAAVYSRLAKPSVIADAFALGLQAAAFPEGRIRPVAEDVLKRAEEYLVAESERVRPAISVNLDKAEKQMESHLTALKNAVEANNPIEVGKATEAVTRGVLGNLKESHEQCAAAIGRLSEESQFLWWILGRRSPLLKAGRGELSTEAYALSAAAEAAARVWVLPPATSVEALIGEALAQCGNDARASTSLLELIAAGRVQPPAMKADAADLLKLVPIAALVVEQHNRGKVDAGWFKKLAVRQKTKVTPIQAARQYFRELTFLRALEELH